MNNLATAHNKENITPHTPTLMSSHSFSAQIRKVVICRAELIDLIKKGKTERCFYSWEDQTRKPYLIFESCTSNNGEEKVSYLFPHEKKNKKVIQFLLKEGFTPKSSCPPSLIPELVIHSTENSRAIKTLIVIPLLVAWSSAVYTVYTAFSTTQKDSSALASPEVITDKRKIAELLKKECNNLSCGLKGKDVGLLNEIAALTDALSPETAPRLVSRIEERLKAGDPPLRAVYKTFFEEVSIKPDESMTLLPFEKKVVHYHEHGHALIRFLFGHTSSFISFRPRPPSLGMVGPPRPTEDEYRSQLVFVDTLYNTLLVSVAGRVSEKVFIGPSAQNTGADKDYENAAETARKIVQAALVEDYADVEEKNLEQPDVTTRKLLKAAFRCVEQIFQEVPRHEMESLVDGTLSRENTEMFPDEIVPYYESRISNETREKAKRIIDRFYKKPLSFVGKNSLN